MVPKNWDAEPDDYFRPASTRLTAAEIVAQIKRVEENMRLRCHNKAVEEFHRLLSMGKE